ncbi:MAG: FHA domain-containing protein, partial [Calditrichaeota bacterium]
MPKLILKRGDFIVKKLFVPPDILAFTVGSEQGNDIIINDDLISFFHLQFEKQGSTYYVRDLQSERGTFVNGARIPGRTKLKSYDEIGLGKHSITFIDGESKPAPAVKAERYRLEHAGAHPNIEEKLAGAPTLSRLNAWLRNEPNGVKPQENHQERAPETPDFITDDSEFFSEQRNGADTQHDNSGTFPRHENAPADARSENEPVVGKTNGYLGHGTDTKPEPVWRNTAEAEAAFTGGHGPKTAHTTDDEIEKPDTTHYLLGIHGYYLGRRFRVKHPETRIGRDPKHNDIVIRKNAKSKTDHSVSRRQAIISFKNGKYVISDRRSK